MDLYALTVCISIAQLRFESFKNGEIHRTNGSHNTAAEKC